MSYLIDTHVLSELRRKAPNVRVKTWMRGRSAASLYLSVLTLGEIRKGLEGIDGINDSKRRAVLLDWLEHELPAFFSGRVLGIDAAVADRWGRMVAAAGRPVPAIDGLFAATAAEHDLVLVTRNVRDFAGLPVQLLDPWAEAV